MACSESLVRNRKKAVSSHADYQNLPRRFKKWPQPWPRVWASVELGVKLNRAHEIQVRRKERDLIE